jgi:mono/diheme cytochrome c family protein
MNRWFWFLSVVGIATMIAAPVHAQGASPATQEQPAEKPAGQPPDKAVERLFATSCGWCHQGGGRVAGRGPKLAGTDKPDEFIIKQIRQGKPPGMPAFKGFNDDQIRAIVAYIRALPDTQ